MHRFSLYDTWLKKEAAVNISLKLRIKTEIKTTYVS